MEHLITQIPGWIVTAMIGLFGIAVGWGFFKSEVNHLKENQINQRIKIESLIAHCEVFRGECSKRMDNKFDEIKKSISENRVVTTKQFEEIKEFMGYVRRVIEEANGKRG